MKDDTEQGGPSFIEWIGIAILIGVVIATMMIKSGGEPGRCVQEDSYMGENVVTCEPYE